MSRAGSSLITRNSSLVLPSLPILPKRTSRRPILQPRFLQDAGEEVRHAPGGERRSGDGEELAERLEAQQVEQRQRDEHTCDDESDEQALPRHGAIVCAALL